MSNTVSVVDVDDNVDLAVEKAISLVGGFSPVDGSHVVIKPNLCTARKSADSGVTTDVRVVEALIRYIMNVSKGTKITIVEADSDMSADEAFKRLGYTELSKKYGIKFKNLTNDRIVKLLLPDGKKLATLEVPETLLFMDYFVTVSKLKRHAAERFTAIWKNQYGCIPHKPRRLELHPFMAEVLYDLNKVYWSDLSLVDAIICLEGSGPIDGNPRLMNKIICSKNPLSADVYGSSLVGEKAQRIPSLNYALKHGFKEASNIQVVKAVKDDTPIQLSYISGRQYLLYRLGLRLRRLGLYCTNFGSVIQNVAYAIRAMGFSESVSGKFLPSFSLPKIVWRMIFRFETSERLV